MESIAKETEMNRPHHAKHGKSAGSNPKRKSIREMMGVTHGTGQPMSPEQTLAMRLMKRSASDLGSRKQRIAAASKRGQSAGANRTGADGNPEVFKLSDDEGGEGLSPYGWEAD